MNLPKARTRNLIERALDNELLIYDLMDSRAISLNETAALVYQACDAGKTFEELKLRHRFTDDLIHLTLDELKKQSLIEGEYKSPLAEMNRRQVIKRVGLASVIAMPLIYSIATPIAAQGASLRPLFASCSSNSDCASNYCVNGPPRCCVPGTAGIRGATVCCDGTTAN